MVIRFSLTNSIWTCIDWFFFGPDPRLCWVLTLTNDCRCLCAQSPWWCAARRRPVITRPRCVCWAATARRGRSTPAPAGTGPSSRWASSWCRAAWRAAPWWWPASRDPGPGTVLTLARPTLHCRGRGGHWLEAPHTSLQHRTTALTARHSGMIRYLSKQIKTQGSLKGNLRWYIFHTSSFHLI